jgi:hypothetical protein
MVSDDGDGLLRGVIHDHQILDRVPRRFTG